MIPLLILFGGGPGFVRERSGDHVAHRIISFMAGVLEKLVSWLVRDWEGDRPGRSIGFRIVDLQLVFDRIVRQAREAFRQLHILAAGDAAAIGTDRKST